MDENDLVDVREPEFDPADCHELLTADTRANIVVNKFSSVVHIVSEPEKLACGRPLNSSYMGISKEVSLLNYPSCKQCDSAKLTVFLPAQGRDSCASEHSLPSVAGGDATKGLDKDGLSVTDGDLSDFSVVK